MATVRTIPSPSSPSGLSISDIKRVNRQLKRAHSKLARKVGTLRKLREDSHNLGKSIEALREEERNLLNPMWDPPVPNNY